jgi:hypothetical protein
LKTDYDYGIISSKEVVYMTKNKLSDERFEKVYSQGHLNITEIWVDKETGVNYMFHASGNSGGLTVLLDRDGKPVVSPIA